MKFGVASTISEDMSNMTAKTRAMASNLNELEKAIFFFSLFGCEIVILEDEGRIFWK